MSPQELGFGAIACLGLLVAAVLLWAARHRFRLAVGAAAVCLATLLGTIGWMLWSAYGPSRVLTAHDVLPPATDQGFTGSDSCRSCHPDQHASWHATFHRTMTQPATPETVVAPFENVRLATDGSVAELSRRGNEFWADIADPLWELEQLARGLDASDGADPPRKRVQLVMTTGSHHFQAYWYRGDQGRELWQFPWRYHLPSGQWLHRRDVFLVGAPWRPGAQFQVWNRNCILCHATGGQPGHDRESDVMKSTRVAELGIACEACHGPGEEHAARMKAGRATAAPRDLAIVNPARLSAERSSEVCGRCHSHFHHGDGEVFTTGTNFRPGDRLADFGKLLTLEDEEPDQRRYWADGTNCSGGREFSSMRVSRCYEGGKLSCLNCHSMHNSHPDDQLTARMDGNEACYQCHPSFRERLAEHTHHAPDSAGSRCYNCHMPHTTLALLKAIRNHQIDSPQVQGTSPGTRPNACNLCHLDQTLGWTADHLNRWYGQDPPELTAEEQLVAASLLWLLRGDAVQRAVAAWHFGWQPAQQASDTFWMPPPLAAALDDPYRAVRWIAARSLRSLPAYGDLPLPNDAQRPDDPRLAREVLEKWMRQPASPSETGVAAELEKLLLLDARRYDEARSRAVQSQRPVERFMLVE